MSSETSGFDPLGLDGRILQALAEEGYITPTPIQRDAIPPALEGRTIAEAALRSQFGGHSEQAISRRPAEAVTESETGGGGKVRPG